MAKENEGYKAPQYYYWERLDGGGKYISNNSRNYIMKKYNDKGVYVYWLDDHGDEDYWDHPKKKVKNYGEYEWKYIYDENGKHPMVSGDGAKLTGTGKADAIHNDADNVTISAGGGDDYIGNAGSSLKISSNVLINAGSGKNYIDIWKSKDVNITAGSGNDTVFLDVSSKIKVDLGTGKNYICNNDSDNVTITAGSGNDTIENFNSNVSIVAGAGNDTILNGYSETFKEGGSNVTIDGGKGDDYIYNYGSNVSINSGDGNNLINISGGNKVTIMTGNNTDSIVVDNFHLAKVSIQSGEGKNLISLCGGISSVRIDGGENEISVLSDGQTIKGGADDDSITIVGSDNDIFTSNSETDVQGTDADFVFVKKGSDNKIKTGYGDDTVWSTDKSSGSTISTGYGKDSIRNEGNYISINSGYSNDTIKNYGEYVTIKSGDPSIAAGKNQVTNYANYVTIYGGGDNDTIKNSGQGVSINAGSGNDVIKLNSVIDVDDVFHSIADPLVPIGEDIGSMIPPIASLQTIKDILDTFDFLTDDSKTTKEKVDKFSDLADSDLKDTLPDILDELSENNRAYQVAKSLLDRAKSAANKFNLLKDVVNAYNSYSKDKIFSLLAKQLLSGFEKNSSGNWGFASKTISEPVTVRGGTGNDKIYGDSLRFNVYEYKSGDGNDTIYGWNSNDTLRILSGKYSGKIVGKDYVVTVGKGSITFKNFSSHKVQRVLVDGELVRQPLQIEGYTKDGIYHEVSGGYGQSAVQPPEGISVDYSELAVDDNFSGEINLNKNYSDYVRRVDASNAGNVEIIGKDDVYEITSGKGNDKINNVSNGSVIESGAGKDLILNSGNNSEINSGKGNDTIISFGNENTIAAGKGNDTIFSDGQRNVFVFNSGDGNKVIYGFGKKDSLKISGGSYKTSLSSSDIIATVGKNKVTLIDAANLSSLKINGKDIMSLTLTDKSDSVITLDSMIKIANASKRTKAIKITGNKLDNTISGGSKNDKLYGGKGDDSIVGNAGNDILYGQKGNDTLWGGAGNDSLYGGDGNDTFIYKPGEGTDKIFDYQSGDMLKILKSNGKAGGTFTDSTFKNNNLTLAIDGGGSVIFDGVSKGDNININGTIHTISGNKLK